MRRLTTFLILFFLKSYTCDVIIVGAGSAGIAAASALLCLMPNVSVTVLEATDRLGGRIHSVDFADGVVDLGAQWCHGEVNNTVYEMVKDLNLLEDREVQMNFLHSSGEELNSEILDKIVEFADDYESLMSIVNVTSKSLTAEDVLQTAYNETILTKYPNDASVWQYYLTFEGLILGVDGAFATKSVAAASDYEECEGSQLLNWKNRGYKTVLDVLMGKFTKNRLPVERHILFNKQVSKVTWHGKDTTKVECSDGSAYTAENVIFTPSVGVLKNREVAFEPSLPKKKLKVVDDLGFDAVGKIFLHFPDKWWPDVNATTLAIWSFVWGLEDRQKVLLEFPEGPVKNGKSWLLDLTHVYTLPYNENVLSVWLSGENIPEIEKLSDDVLTRGVVFLLRKFFSPEYNVTDPDSMLRTKWYTDRRFRGSYSYQTVASLKYSSSAVKILAEPLVAPSGRMALQFAGEATNPTHYSTVHGAIETGFREVQRVIDCHLMDK